MSSPSNPKYNGKENDGSVTKRNLSTLTRAASKKLKKIRLLITSLDEQNSSRKKDLNDKHLPVLENVDINVDVDSTKQKNPQKRDSPKNKINRMGKKNRQKGNPEAYHQDGKTNPFE